MKNLCDHCEEKITDDDVCMFSMKYKSVVHLECATGKRNKRIEVELEGTVEPIKKVEVEKTQAEIKIVEAMAKQYQKKGRRMGMNMSKNKGKYE